jgi:poly(3-hydroxybutyrate) depolymerase
MREGGGLVGRRAVSGSFSKKTLIQGWAKTKKSGIKTVRRKKKKTDLGNRNWADKKGPEEKKTYQVN